MNESAQYYTPGYRRCKVAMMLFGLALLFLGLSQVWPPLRLVLFGKSAIAEAIAVIKSKPGLPDLVLSDELELQSKVEARDRTYIFWTLFSYRTKEGIIVEVRSPVGSQLQPLYPLLDADGLPTSDFLFYDPKDPQNVVFPLTVSTWFAAGVLLVAGLACTLIGAVLYYWADKPIELPHIRPPAPNPSASP